MDGNTQTGVLIEPWMVRLKGAYNAGYYRTEVASESQEQFPWEGKRCDQCPFYEHGTCKIRALARSRDAHTCRYFSPSLYDEGRDYIATHDEFTRRTEWAQEGAQDR